MLNTYMETTYAHVSKMSLSNKVAGQLLLRQTVPSIFSSFLLLI